LSGSCNTVELDKDLHEKGKDHASGIDKFRNDTDGWKYDPYTGDVWVNNEQTDTIGCSLYIIQLSARIY